MTVSVFDLFSIGIGPSSSHTVGPMRATNRFLRELKPVLNRVERVHVDLFGSLALTGIGHGTNKAILLGLEGQLPEDANLDALERIRKEKRVCLSGKKTIHFCEKQDILFHKEATLPYHPNGMRFTAFSEGRKLLERVYYSVGGGFVVGENAAKCDAHLGDHMEEVPYPFFTADALLGHCEGERRTIADVVLENEKIWRKQGEIEQGLLKIWDVMQQCVKEGISKEGVLPGGLNVQRRARGLYLRLSEEKHLKKPTEVMEWVSLWALAVNEENAAGARVVTAPTNGAAGIIPAVLHYYTHFTESPTDAGIITFLLTAGAIGILYKEGASISAAEMGCMGEVGVACSMAAAGLTAALGGSNLQIENAAEIGMEHNLGLTCDPIKGLVQIPCIERNTMGAVKAINASLLGLQGDGTHRVSLDQVIATMRQTGQDMKTIYKETSLGGLAVNVPEC